MIHNCILLDSYFTVLIEYAKDLMLKAIDIYINEEDKPTLPDTPSPLASAYEHPRQRFNSFIFTL